MMVIGWIEDNIITSAILYINADQFEVKLTGELSPNQQKLYYNTGIYGNLVSQRPAPRLETARRKAFNP